MSVNKKTVWEQHSTVLELSGEWIGIMDDHGRRETDYCWNGAVWKRMNGPEPGQPEFQSFEDLFHHYLGKDADPGIDGATERPATSGDSLQEAAPNLLAACKRLVKMWETNSQRLTTALYQPVLCESVARIWEDEGDLLLSAVKDAQSAIAKAEGQEEANS